MTEYQKRRFWRAWLPITLIGLTLTGLSYTITTTMNGLTMLGSLIGLTGLGLMAWEARDS